MAPSGVGIGGVRQLQLAAAAQVAPCTTAPRTAALCAENVPQAGLVARTDGHQEGNVAAPFALEHPTTGAPEPLRRFAGRLSSPPPPMAAAASVLLLVAPDDADHRLVRDLL